MLFCFLSFPPFFLKKKVEKRNDTILLENQIPSLTYNYLKLPVMIKRLYVFILPLLMVSFLVAAQDDASYKMPPKDIADMLLAKSTPNVSLDDKGEWMLF